MHMICIPTSLNQVINDLNNTASITDDVLIWVIQKQGHNKALDNLLEICETIGKQYLPVANFCT